MDVSLKEFYNDILAEQNEIVEKLDSLKKEYKEKTITYKELFYLKMININVLNKIEEYLKNGKSSIKKYYS
jgi:hypothetical protein